MSEAKASRRARGDYTVFWVESRQRWRAETVLGYDVRGKRHLIARHGTSKSAALAALRAAVKEAEAGRSREAVAVTVETVVREWLEFDLGGRSPATLASIDDTVRLHVLPYLGAAKLAKLKPLDVERWLKTVAEDHSTRSVQMAHSCLRRALDRAVLHGLVNRNVAAVVKTPPGRRAGRPSKSLPLEVVGRVMQDTSSHWFYPFIALLLLTGIRVEEARALKWEDVHLDVERPYLEVVRSTRWTGDTKTRLSRRGLGLPALCVDALGRQQDLQARMRGEAGDRWQDTGLVFTTRWGSGFATSNMRRAFRSALKLVDGINPEEWTPKELRHTFVSVLSASGVSIDEIAQYLGHSGTAVTEEVYRHQLRPVLRGSAATIDAVFAGSAAHPVSHPVTPLPGDRKLR